MSLEHKKEIVKYFKSEQMYSTLTKAIKYEGLKDNEPQTLHSLLKEVDARDLIASAFIWGNTKQGQSYWSRAETKFRAFLDKNNLN